MPTVGVVIGSKSDAAAMQPALDILQELGIEFDVSVISAHRTPEKARDYGLKAKNRGIEVIIAAAGLSAHLPGVLASWTTVPVIGVPLAAGELRGLDSLYSIVQMPGGVPVACVGIGPGGAKNAGLLAAQILGMKYGPVQSAYEEYRKRLSGE
ncbi:MAG: 5-(carboxyamino)imidazole ribonucleotide mutase [Chloroflexi bacterium]|nr:5-(carboxyamino)imidazole ribonucleotide mutase [Chloroflexota bacterium]